MLPVLGCASAQVRVAAVPLPALAVSRDTGSAAGTGGTITTTRAPADLPL